MLIIQNPTADTYINSYHYDLNYRSYIVGWVGMKSISSIYRLLLKFDISAIPKKIMLNYAKLRLYVDDAQDRSTAGYFTPYPILAAWKEHTVTWETAPVFDKNEPGQTIAINDTGWYEWDIKNFVASWCDGSLDNNGLIHHFTSY